MMEVPDKRHVRLLFAVVLVLSAAPVTIHYATAEQNLAERTGSSQSTTTGWYGDAQIQPNGSEPAVSGTGFANGSVNDSAASFAGRDNESHANSTTDAGNLTVVATQGFYVSDEQAELVAFDETGAVAYYDDSYRVYFDVDPVSGMRATVEYVAAKHLEGEECNQTARCTYNVVKRVNLTTGVEREMYGEVTPQIYSGRWHDVDRINETHLVIADIVQDSVRVVDATTGETTWRWVASTHYDQSQGGKQGDWTHVNDVEVLPDGRIMASIRNMDQVVFIDPGEGVEENWTLGSDDSYDVLYEQHNPDYIPPSMGGPAVVVADSENGRVLEFRRIDPETGNTTTAPNGKWRPTWGWRDSRLQWPRDVDRLPNNNSIIVDTHGDRIVEVAPNGSIVWSVTVGMPYDVERLNTGAESTGGQSIGAIRGENPTETSDSDLITFLGPWTSDAVGLDGQEAVTRPRTGVIERFWITLKHLTPSILVNGLLYASPSWVRFPDLVFGCLFLLSAFLWGILEIHWSTYLPVQYLRRLRRNYRLN